MLETIIIATIIVAVIGLILGALIGYAAKRFSVEVDPRIESVAGALPGVNCGGCGYAGCADFAKAIVLDKVSPTLCPVSSEENINNISTILGIAAEKKEKKKAVVFCGGSLTRAGRSAKYNGVKDCRSANIVAGGGKGCRFGCLGYGSCARACPFGAIEIRDGLAVVHPEICVGCGKCLDICPRKLIKLVTADAKVHVYCNSLEKGPAKKKNCTVPCIACRKCVKVAEENMSVSGFLVRVNYSNPPGPDIIEKAGCPTGCLHTAEAHCRLVPKQQEPAAGKSEKENAA